MHSEAMRSQLALALMMLSSLLLALLLELTPLPHELGAWRAPWLLVMVVFWSLQLPAVAGIGVAWTAGLFLDAASAAPLGTHALIFTLASALSLALRRLLLTFSVFQQAVWMAALAVMQYGILLLIYPSAGASGLVQTALAAAFFWLALHVVLFRWIRPRLYVD